MSGGAAARLRTRIGRRGAALLFFTLLDLVYGTALLTAPRPLTAFYQWMDNILPLPIWAGFWIMVGLICLAFAFMRADTTAFMFAVSLKVAWGGLAFFGWTSGIVPLGYLSAVIWFAFAAFVYLIAGGIPPAYRPEGGGWPWSRSLGRS